MRISFNKEAPIKAIASFCANSMIIDHKRGAYDGVFFGGMRDPLHYELYVLIHSADESTPEGKYFRCILDLDDETKEFWWGGQYHVCLASELPF